MSSLPKATLSLLGWFIVPNLATSFLQTVYYKATIRLGDPVPTPGTPKYDKHKRAIYALVIGAYLVYSVVEAFWNVLGQFSPNSTANGLYGTLGVSPLITDRELRSTFRKLSLVFHPDKVRNASGFNVEERWISIKDSYDILANNVFRYAYDRYGDSAIGMVKQFQKAGSAGTFETLVMMGIQQKIVAFYGSMLVILVFLSVIGFAKTGQIWRYFILAGCATTELYLHTHSNELIVSNLPALSWFKLAPYQVIEIMHNLMFTSFVAINQLGPLLSNGKQHSLPINTKKGQEQLLKQLETIEKLSSYVDYESTQSLAHQLMPFQSDPQLLAKAKERLTEELIEKRLSSDIFMRDALSHVDTQKLRAAAGKPNEVTVPTAENASGQARPSVRKRK
ncbi:hypothetical protein DV453_003741 [Geotrichum candidum]|nr:hypothetical protein DV453_003741 [Geotrichum candidum]